MARDEHGEHQVAAYALNALTPRERAEFEAHLRACPRCSAELISYQAVVDQLPLAAPDAEPPPHLRTAILEAARRTPHPHLLPKAAPERRRSPRALPAWAWAFGLALAVLLAFAGLLRLLNPPGEAGSFRLVALRGDAAAPEARAVLVINATGEYGTLVVDQLPTLPQGQQYQLWLIENGRRDSGAVFSVNDSGYQAVVVYAPRPLSEYPGFGVTVEPEGGSPAPTGPRVLGGEQ